MICLDFDGTVVDNFYPDIGQPVPGAIGWLTKWQGMGIKIILWTMRDGQALKDAVKYLKDSGIELLGVNKNPEQGWTTSPKVHGLYIDDSAAGCPLIKLPGFNKPCVDWDKLGPIVEQRLGL